MKSSRPLRIPDSPWAHSAPKGWHELIDAGVPLNPRLAPTPIESGPQSDCCSAIAESRKRSHEEHQPRSPGTTSLGHQHIQNGCRSLRLRAGVLIFAMCRAAGTSTALPGPVLCRWGGITRW